MTDMLGLAVAAGLPIIAVRTRDALNFPEILQEVVGKKPIKYSSSSPPKKNSLYFKIVGKTEKAAFDQSLYKQFAEIESSLVIVNPTTMEDFFFDAGEAPVPKAMLSAMLGMVTEDPEKVEELMIAMGGVTLKESVDFAKLTMARDKSLTGNGVVRTRKESFADATGLYFVDTHQDLYVPDPDLHEWAKREGPFFLHEQDPRLIPRGILADGPPGTGKSAGAKYLADMWGVPLYRLDMSSTKSKWVGQSQANLKDNLARIDREEPCILLIDEIEKSMSRSRSEGDSGTSTDMLSQVLWWLAEHRSRVLTYMTTNNADALPPELIREGRVDMRFVFPGLGKEEAGGFACTVLDSFQVSYTAADVAEVVKEAFAFSTMPTDPPTVSHAAVTAASKQLVKSLKAEAAALTQAKGVKIIKAAEQAKPPKDDKKAGTTDGAPDGE